ncbi:MAG: ATP-binding protein [Pleurocapsa sp.]
MLQLVSFKKLNCQWSKIPVSYRGGLILAIPAVCIIAILVAWSELRQDVIAAHREIDRSESTLIETNSLLQLISSAETGVQSYVITKQANFLEPYNKAVIDLADCLEKLEDLQQNTPRQEDVREITTLVEEELDLLAEILALTQTQNAAPDVNVLLNQSKNKINRIGIITNAFRAEAREILSTRRHNLFDIRETTNIAFWSAAVVSLLSFLAALYLFNLLERELNNKQEDLRSRASELTDLNYVLATTNNTLEESNLELDRFCYIVSHDLKAPLRGIRNLSDWIEEDLADKLTKDNQKYFHLQRERIGRMENLIDGLLQYARVGRKDVTVETVDVRQLLSEVIDSIAPPPEFTIAISDQMPIITTQRLYLEQVFSNLISNGIKHHPRLDGKIAISVREQESFYEFTIADDGAGIAPMAQKRVFDIFSTLDRGENKSNTGVGLAIVKKIVEERGGKITLESEEGKGASFCFQWIK